MVCIALGYVMDKNLDWKLLWLTIAGTTMASAPQNYVLQMPHFPNWNQKPSNKKDIDDTWGIMTASQNFQSTFLKNEREKLVLYVCKKDHCFMELIIMLFHR